MTTPSYTTPWDTINSLNERMYFLKSPYVFPALQLSLTVRRFEDGVQLLEIALKAGKRLLDELFNVGFLVDGRFGADFRLLSRERFFFGEPGGSPFTVSGSFTVTLVSVRLVLGVCLGARTYPARG